MIARLSRNLEVLDSNLPPGMMPALTEQDGYILAIADGVGGMNAGAHASSLVIARGIEFILASSNWGLKLDDPESRQRLLNRIREYMTKINDSLRQATEADPNLEGMATTLTVVYAVGLQAFIVHVGDGRVYLLRDGRLAQLTRDHTVAQNLADSGSIAHDEISTHPRKHVLTNVLAGATAFQQPDISSHQLKTGDLLLMGSDGLSDHLDASMLTRILMVSPGPVEACTALIDAALKAGGRDNITAVVARFMMVED